MEKSKKIKDLIEYSKKYVPFYNNLYKDIDEYSDIPILEKERVLDSGCGMISSKYIINTDSIISFKTSGSTGKCLDVKWDKSGYNKSIYDLWILRYKFYGIKPNDKFCYFYSDISPTIDEEEKWYRIDKTKKRLGFSKTNLSNDKMIAIFDNINKFKPMWLNLQPTVGIIIADFMKKNNISLPESVKYIEFTGEFVEDNTMNYFRNVFDCTVSNQYGAYEFNSIAFMCPNGHLHIVKNNVFVEIEQKDIEGYGKIIVTNLHNKCMPFIKYNTGDIGKIEQKECEYNLYGKDILVLKNGRQCDNAILSDGYIVNFYIFYTPIYMINERYNNVIRQFRIIQNDYNYFIVWFCLNNERCDEIGLSREMLENIYLDNISKEKKLMNTEFEFFYSEELLPDDKTGKLRYFIRNVK